MVEKKIHYQVCTLYQLCSFLFLPSHNKLTYCGGEVENFENFVNLGIRVLPPHFVPYPLPKFLHL